VTRALLLIAAVGVLTTSASGAGGWQRGAPMQSPRSEVAATPYRGGIAVVGGFSPGRVSNKVELYLPARNRWLRLPDLPIAAHHAVAAAAGGKLYVVGGYGSPRLWMRAALVYDGKRWRRLAPMPAPRGRRPARSWGESCTSSGA
jgi:hypothetical protein